MIARKTISLSEIKLLDVLSKLGIKAGSDLLLQSNGTTRLATMKLLESLEKELYDR